MPTTQTPAMTGAKMPRGGGQHGQGEAQEAVGAELQEDAGEDDGAGGGGFGMGEGQPGVQGEKGHFHGKAREQAEEEDVLRRGGDAGGKFVEVVHGKGEGAVAGHLGIEVGDVDQRGQREDGAGEGEEEELAAALRRSGPPQMPMMKNMGMSVNSKKR